MAEKKPKKWTNKYLGLRNMQSKTVLVTPEMAKFLLTGNDNNRAVHKARVYQYARDIKSDRFNFHGQGITLGLNGKLIDGQHRLKAIVQAGKAVHLSVSRNDDYTKPGEARVDRGASRGLAMMLGIPTKHASITNTMCSVVFGLNMSTDEKGDVYLAIAEEIDILLAASRSNVSGVTLASIRAAVVGAMVAGECQGYCTDQYKALATISIPDMTPMVCSLYSQLRKFSHGTGNPGLRKQSDWFIRGFCAFDESRKTTKELRIVNEVKTLDQIRAKLKKIIKARINGGGEK